MSSQITAAKETIITNETVAYLSLQASFLCHGYDIFTLSNRIQHSGVFQQRTTEIKNFLKDELL